MDTSFLIDAAAERGLSRPAEPTDKPDPKALLTKRSTAYLVFILLVSITIALWLTSRERDSDLLLEKFNHEAAMVVHEISDRVKNYERVLRAGAGLYEASTVVTQDEWDVFVKALDVERHLPAAQGLGYMRMLPSATTTYYQSWVNRTAGRYFNMRDHGPSTEDSAINFVEPTRSGTLLSGLGDISALATKSLAMLSARDTGKMTLSDSVVVRMPGHETADELFYLFYPVYRTYPAPSNVEARRHAIRGYVFTAFRASEFMAGIKGLVSSNTSVRLYDVNRLRFGDDLIYAVGSETSAHKFQKSLDINIADKVWRLTIAGEHSFNANEDTRHSLTILVAGLIFSMVVLVFMLMVIDNRKQLASLENVVRRSRDNYRQLLDNVPGVVFRLDLTVNPWRIVMLNNRIDRIAGHSRNEIMANEAFAVDDYIHDDNKDLVKQARTAAIRTGDPYSVEFRVISTGKEIRWFEEQGQTSLNEVTGDREFLDVVVMDITERKANYDSQRKLAFYDTLTGLPNRRLLADRIDHQLVSTDRSGKWSAICFIDMDNFKFINDTLGHRAGDLLLQQVAGKLTACVRSIDTVSRIGGDEFIVLLEDIGDSALEAVSASAVVAKKMLADLDVPFNLEGQLGKSTPSIGIAIFSGTSVDSEQLIGRADEAMYSAKAAGKNCLMVWGYDESLYSQVRQMRLPIDDVDHLCPT